MNNNKKLDLGNPDDFGTYQNLGADYFMKDHIYQEWCEEPSNGGFEIELKKLPSKSSLLSA